MSILLTERDMTDEENVKQCRHEFERATDAAARDCWAKRWGEALISTLAANEAKGEIERLEEEVNDAQNEKEHTQDALEKALAVLDKIDITALTDAAKHIEAAAVALENA